MPSVIDAIRGTWACEALELDEPTIAAIAYALQDYAVEKYLNAEGSREDGSIPWHTESRRERIRRYQAIEHEAERLAERIAVFGQHPASAYGLALRFSKDDSSPDGALDALSELEELRALLHRLQLAAHEASEDCAVLDSRGRKKSRETLLCHVIYAYIANSIDRNPTEPPSHEYPREDYANLIHEFITATIAPVPNSLSRDAILRKLPRASTARK